MENELNNRVSTPQLEADAVAVEQRAARELASPLRRTFASLLHRDYLLFWSGAWLSNIGNWLQSVALGWLVLEMTNSSLHLGLVQFAASLPVFLFSFSAGILADRLNKKTLITATQVALMLLAFLLGALVSLKIHTILSVMLLALIAGIISTYSFPAWQALISEIVPRRDLLNAIALNSAQFHAARLVGPMLAGGLIHLFGVASCFYLNSVSFLAVIGALLAMRHNPAPPRRHASVWAEFTEGWRYIRGRRLLMYLLAGVGLVSVFGITFYMVLMPKFARDVLHGDAKTFGFLMGAGGFGALAGALTVANLSSLVRRATILRAGLFTFSISLFVFAFSANLFLSMAALVTAGFSSLSVVSTLNTTIQAMVPQHIRGRVMSFFMWMFMGWMPLGSLSAGLLAEWIGPPRAVALAAMIPFSLSIYLLVKIPNLDGWDGDRAPEASA